MERMLRRGWGAATTRRRWVRAHSADAPPPIDGTTAAAVNTSAEIDVPPRLVTAIAHATEKGVYTVEMAHGPANVLSAQLLDQLTATLNILAAAATVGPGGPQLWAELQENGLSKSRRAQLRALTANDRLHDVLTANPPTGVILASGVPGCFSAGLDLDFLASDPAPAPEGFAPYWFRFQEAWRCLQMLPIPVVAAIEGNAPAGGCILATCCDCRVMARRSQATNKRFTMGITATRAGFAPPPWALRDLERVVGPRNAEHLATTAQLLGADDAHRLGLVDSVVDSDAPGLATEVALAKLREYELGSRWGYWLAKETFRREVLAMLPVTREGRAADTRAFYHSRTRPEARSILLSYRAGVGSSRK